jgi:hypothetical protein
MGFSPRGCRSLPHGDIKDSDFNSGRLEFRLGHGQNGALDL